MIDLQNGIFLIANPSLDDPHFFKSVVLLCAHNDEESIGFIINKKTNIYIGVFSLLFRTFMIVY